MSDSTPRTLSAAQVAKARDDHPPTWLRLGIPPLAAVTFVTLASLLFYYSLDQRVDQALVSANAPETGGLDYHAFSPLTWKLMVDGAFPRDVNPKLLVRGDGGAVERFLHREFGGLIDGPMGALAGPMLRQIVHVYIKKRRLLLYFANSWVTQEGQRMGLAQAARRRFDAPLDALEPLQLATLIAASLPAEDGASDEERGRRLLRLAAGKCPRSGLNDTTWVACASEGSGASPSEGKR